MESLTKQIDLHVYFPVGVFPLSSDGIRPMEHEFQQEIDSQIAMLLEELVGEKCLKLVKDSPEERASEIIGAFDKLIVLKGSK